MLVSKHVMIPLPKYDNCFLVRTDPRDVARTESRTFLSTDEKRDSVPTPEGSKSQLGNWIHPDQLEAELDRLFPGCMTGRTMYVIPFSMGPVGSPLSRIGIEITDSAYVAISMGVMTRVGQRVLDVLGEGQFVKVSLSLSDLCSVLSVVFSVSTVLASLSTTAWPRLAGPATLTRSSSPTNLKLNRSSASAPATAGTLCWARNVWR